MTYDVIVIGGGLCGAIAANDLARAGCHVAFLDRAGRIKPCGGAIPPRLIADFAIPASQIVARLNRALGEQTVLRVEFRGPRPPSWKKGLRSVQGRGPRDTYG